MLRLSTTTVTNGYALRALPPDLLDSCETKTIRAFFRKSWRYMDAYRCVPKLFTLMSQNQYFTMYSKGLTGS